MRFEKGIPVLFFLALAVTLSPALVMAKSFPVINPCEIITQANAGELMGEQMQAGLLREQKAVGLRLCVYEPVDVNSLKMLQISIIQGESAKDIYLEIKSNLPDHETIAGMGEDAFVGIPGIHILKRDCYVSIAAGNLNSNRDRVVAAGQTAAAYLETLLK